MHNDETHTFKKSFINYIDISLAFMNFLIIVYPLIAFCKNIYISIIGIFLSSILIIIIFFNFIKNNPLYVYYCYALVVSSLLFLILLLRINPVLGILILPEVYYIYTFYIETEIYSQDQIPYDNSISLYMIYIPKRRDSSSVYKRAKRIEIIKKQYNSKKNFKYSLIVSLSLIFTFVLYILF